MDVLVVGASGAVGAELCRRLDRAEGVRVRRVSRTGSDAWRVGAEPPPEPLRRRWDVIVNAVADTRWALSPMDARAANVDTTAALLELAHSATHLVQVSTIGVDGREGVSDPQRLEDFHNTYEWSKAEAEALVRERFPSADIVRLPLIVGRRADGHIDRFSGFFGLLRGLCSGAIPAIVGHPDAYVDIASTDDAAALVEGLIASGPPQEPSVTVLGGGAAALSVDLVMKVAVEALNVWRTAHGSRSLDPPPYVPPDTWDRLYLPLARVHLSPGQRSVLDAYHPFRHYFVRRRPLTITHRVDDPMAAIARTVAHWADRHTAAAAREPRSWMLIGGSA